MRPVTNKPIFGSKSTAELPELEGLPAACACQGVLSKRCHGPSHSRNEVPKSTIEIGGL